jgi:hypothetical protein
MSLTVTHVTFGLGDTPRGCVEVIETDSIIREDLAARACTLRDAVAVFKVAGTGDSGSAESAYGV